jgi:WD40 repeat protein
MFHLSSITKAHTADIKSISCFSQLGGQETLLATASRDNSVRVWIPVSDPQNKCTTLNLFSEHKEHAGFVNSVAFISLKEDEGSANHPVLASGGVDQMIYLYDLEQQECNNALVGHHSNVCFLTSSPKSGLLLSCSWDKSVIVWKNLNRVTSLIGHTEAIWSACFVNHDNVERILTASADKSIGLWDLETSQQIGVFQGHTDVVRSVASIPVSSPISKFGDFVSVGNDGNIFIWRFGSTKPVSCVRDAHDSYIYAVKCHDDFIVTSGEDRSVRIWKLSEVTDGDDFDQSNALTCTQVLVLPASSIWTIDLDQNGTLFTGCSDGYIYGFSSKSGPLPSEHPLCVELNSRLSKCKVATETLEDCNIDKATNQANVLSAPGKKIGQVLLVSSSSKDGVREAYQWDGQAWICLGEVVSGAENSSIKQKPVFNGVEYDFVFDVEIESSSESLKLPFNVGQNPYTVASKFIADNDLSPAMMDQIVDFIFKNSKISTIERNQPELFNPFMDVPTQKIDQDLILLKYSDFNIEGICKKLSEFSSLEVAPNMAEISATLNEICVNMKNLKEMDRECVEKSLIPGASFLSSLILKWDVSHLYPIFDALRFVLCHINSQTSEFEAICVDIIGSLSIRCNDITCQSSSLLTASRLLCCILRFYLLSNTTRNILSSQELSNLTLSLVHHGFSLPLKDSTIPTNLMAHLVLHGDILEEHTTFRKILLERLRLATEVTPSSAEINLLAFIVPRIMPHFSKQDATEVKNYLDKLRPKYTDETTRSLISAAINGHF